MIRLTVAWLVWLFFLLPFYSPAQTGGIMRYGQLPDIKKFSSLTTADGLSQSNVNCILKDKAGFMWFGTRDGLNRYDGANFVIFRHDPANPHSLPDNQVKTLFEDEQSRLWIGTLGNGLCIYDPNTGSFLRPEDLGFHMNVVIDHAILSMCEDRQGQLWIGTYRGLLCVDRKNKTIRSYQPNPSDPASLTNGTIESLYCDNTGRLFVGTDRGLNALDPATHKFSSWLHDPRRPNSLSADRVTAITGDSKGHLYAGTDGGGLNVLDPGTGSCLSYRQGMGTGSLSSNNVRSLYYTRDGELWVGTESGIDICEGPLPIPGLPAKTGFTHYHRSLIGTGSLSNNTVLSIFEDNMGIVWAGTAEGGVNKYDRNLFYFDLYRQTADPNSLNGTQVTSFAMASNGDVYIGTDGGGLNQWQASTGRFLHHLPGPGNTVAGPAILCLLTATDDQTLWIGTYGNGLDRLNYRSGRFEHFGSGVNGQRLSSRSIYCLLEDSRGNLWIGTNGGGIDILHPDGTITVHRFSGAQDSISNDYIRCLLEDRHGRIWIGTYSGGISVYDTATKKFTVYDNVVHHLSNQVVLSLCEDRHGQIWVGTMGGGLDRFDPERQRFVSFDETAGLSNNIVNSIVEDRNGSLWLSTNKGISRYDPASGKVKNYGIYNGLQSLEFLGGSGYRDPGGKIYFGGIDGFNVFDPQKVMENKVPPVLRFTGFELFNKPVLPGEKHSPLPADLNSLKSLTLSHDQSDFTFSYAALSYTVPEENKYAYQLEGFDRNWNYAGAGHRATYTNLPPGDYLFRVKAANNDGVWSKTETVLAIHVRPPFWKTWWAYLFYVLLTAALLYIIYRDIAGKERLKAQIRLERLTAEKMKELNDIKINFFTHVSHELRTPLSLIMDPLRKLINGEQSKEQTRYYSQLMYDNAQRLTRLINQMLDWRKLETGHLKLEPSRMDMTALAQNIAELFQVHALERNIRYTIVAEAGELWADIDADKFEKIIFNLLSNAFKYTPDGGSISLLIRQTEGFAEIHVTDTGVGIAPEHLDKVFGIFYQVEGAGRFESGSTGIGLALARELALLHKGTLEVKSEKGRGSDFIFRMPMETGADGSFNPAVGPAEGWVPNTEAAEVPAYGEAPAAGMEAAADETAAKSAGAVEDATAAIPDDAPLILLVEDNQPLRNYIKAELDPGYKVLDAKNGAEGWAMALQWVPDLIISDIMMPEMNGLDLCRQIKTDERTSHIPVVLLTARQSEPHQVEGYDAGADAYIPKPFSMEVVEACIKSILESRRRLRERYARRQQSSAVKEEEKEPQIHPLDKAFLEKAYQHVERRLADVLFDVDVLAADLKVSRRQLYRKLKSLTNQTPHEFISGIRLQRAAQLLMKGENTIAEVAYKVGFSEPANFTRSFTRHFGKSPSKYVREST